MTSDAPSPLLAPLSEQQQRLVDLVANAFLQSGYQWPFYSYLEWMYDAEGDDAWATLQSFPQLGRFGYGPVWWVRGSPNVRPGAEAEVALTILGMSHTEQLRPHVPIFFQLLECMATARRSVRPEPRAVPDVTVSNEDFEAWCIRERRMAPHSLLVHQLLEHEPIGAFGGRSYNLETGEWTRAVPREIFDYTGLESVDHYVQRVQAWLEGFEAPAPAISSPAIPIPAALDHLDDVWRLVFGRWLFELRGAERISSLTDEAISREQVEARLGVIGELFRLATAKLPQPSKKRTMRDKPLANLYDAIAPRVPEEARPRIRDAVDRVEAIIALRDSRQHSGAAPRALAATRTLGLPYPITDWPGAWAIITAQAVDAISSVRDELRATLE